MNDQIFIQHRFTIENYSDALVMPLHEYEELSPEDIKVLKEERFTNWKKIISTKQPVVEPTAESLQADIKSLEEQEVIIATQKEDIIAKLAAIKDVNIEEMKADLEVTKK